MELLANTAATTLNNGGSVNNSSDPVTFTVTSSSGFPASGNFRILIGMEILKVTSVSGNDFTAARAQEGTSIATHVDGSPVTHILTKGALLQLLADYNLSGTFSSRPTAGFAGRRYQCTDTPFRYLDNGSSWEKYFGSYPIVTPDDTGFSWISQTNAALTTTKDMLVLDSDSAAITTFLSMRVKTAPSAPYKITMGFFGAKVPSADAYFSAVWRQSSDGKFVSYNRTYENNSFNRVSVWKYNSPNSFNGNYVDKQALPNDGTLLFFRMEDDNTNRICSYSMDGVNFVQVHTVGRTDFMTADQIGFGMYNGQYGKMSLFHWKQE